MAEEKEKRQRFSFGPLYTNENLLSEVNAIPEIASAVTGSDKVVEIIKSFKFLHEWKDKVANLNAGGESERLTQLQNELTNAQDEAKRLGQEKQNLETEKDNRIQELEAQVKQLEEAGETSDNEQIQNLTTENENLKAENERLKAQKPTWDSIREVIDPTYAEMMEEVAEELGQDDPLLMAIDIFVKYHVLRYTELPFQPFIPTKILDAIIVKNNPDLGGLRGLQKQLQ